MKMSAINNLVPIKLVAARTLWEQTGRSASGLRRCRSTVRFLADVAADWQVAVLAPERLEYRR
jgi:hypothetical protein